MDFEVMARVERVAGAMDSAAGRIESYLPLLADEIRELSNQIRQVSTPDTAHLDALILAGNGPVAKAVKATWLINNPTKRNVHFRLSFRGLHEGQDHDPEERREVGSYRYMLDPLIILKTKGELNCNLPGFQPTDSGFDVTITQGVLFKTTVSIFLTGRSSKFHYASTFSMIEDHLISDLGMGATWFLNNVIIPLYELNGIDPVWRTEHNLSHQDVFDAVQQNLAVYPIEQHFYILGQLSDRHNVDSTVISSIVFRPNSLKEDADKPILDEIHVWVNDSPQFPGGVSNQNGFTFERLPQPYRKQVIENLDTYIQGSMKEASERFIQNQTDDE